MKHTTDDLEVRLEALTPRALSRAARAQIAEALTEDGRKAGETRRIPFRAMLSVAAATVLVLGLGLWVRYRGDGRPVVASVDKSEQGAMPTITPTETPRETNSVPTDGYHLVSVDTMVLGSRDTGRVLRQDGSAARRIDYDLVDRVRWHNPGRGRTMTTTRPRRAVRLVSYETY